MSSSSSVVFAAQRKAPVLVAPAKPTPRELKPLSDIDDQPSLRFYRSGLFFYRHDPSKPGHDPARALKEALASCLVFYYPIAGRLRDQGPGGKLLVDCNGEGAVLVEAYADVSIDDFGPTLIPPIPCADELLCFPDSSAADVVDRPLLYIQVTRLKCGGFVFGLQICHNIADAPGVSQFMTALGELGRGADAPTVLPVWERELLTARTRPRITYAHLEYEPLPGDDRISPHDALAHRAFFFGPEEISALQNAAPPRLRSCCSRFELIAAFVWRCRTAALRAIPSARRRPPPVRSQRARQSRQRSSAAQGFLRERVNVWRGVVDDRGAAREAVWLRVGAGEESKGESDGCAGVPAVDGGPDGAAGAAEVRDEADFPCYGFDEGGVGPRRRDRVGKARLRRPGHDDAGNVSLVASECERGRCPFACPQKPWRSGSARRWRA